MKTVQLFNPDRQSGYDHVHFSAPAGGGVPKPFQAIVYGGSGATMDKAGRRWRGPRRATAKESAQDYCNYINGSNQAPRAKLIRAGHIRVGRIPTSVSVHIPRNLPINGYVYCITDGTAVKIGKSTNHPSNRLAELQTGNPRLLSLVAYVEADNVTIEEIRMHQKFAHLNVLGEWFEVHPEIIMEFEQTL